MNIKYITLMVPKGNWQEHAFSLVGGTQATARLVKEMSNGYLLRIGSSSTETLNSIADRAVTMFD